MTIAPKAPRKLTMQERYEALTRDLDWDPTYVEPKDVYPHTRYEGIKIHDWEQVGGPVPPDRRLVLQVPGGEGQEALRRASTASRRARATCR